MQQTKRPNRLDFLHRRVGALQLNAALGSYRLSMNATFRICDGFELPSRRAWVVRGDIIDGTIQSGMFLSFPIIDGASMTAPIQAIEFVAAPSRDATIGLLVACNDDTDRALWRGAVVPGQVLQVTDHDPAA